ncbi:MAG: RnfABCDGE type electron transport complex subunit B [Clostridia bacterium]|nr:RnfABCDGE type electron transport complex subunit B [Clostridia bacterium]
MEILIAFLVMLAIALIVGILLLICSHFFFVPENPLKKEIRACLPGINCGACGFRGCDDYAAALVDGGVKPNLCIPGAQSVADEIGKILDIKVEPLKDVVAFVACNGNCEATHKIAKYEGVKSCYAASMMYGGTNACRFSCLGFGDCAAACPSNAICMNDSIARIDTSRCLGCGICSNTCPKHIINMIPQKTETVVMCSNTQKGGDARKACKNACIGCKKCEKACPNEAITVINNLAVIDHKKCTNCQACVNECPTGCLKTVSFPDRLNEVSIIE